MMHMMSFAASTLILTVGVLCLEAAQRWHIQNDATQVTVIGHQENVENRGEGLILQQPPQQVPPVRRQEIAEVGASLGSSQLSRFDSNHVPIKGDDAMDQLRNQMARQFWIIVAMMSTILMLLLPWSVQHMAQQWREFCSHNHQDLQGQMDSGGSANDLSHQAESHPPQGETDLLFQGKKESCTINNKSSDERIGSNNLEAATSEAGKEGCVQAIDGAERQAADMSPASIVSEQEQSGSEHCNSRKHDEKNTEENQGGKNNDTDVSNAKSIEGGSVAAACVSRQTITGEEKACDEFSPSALETASPPMGESLKRTVEETAVAFSPSTLETANSSIGTVKRTLLFGETAAKEKAAVKEFMRESERKRAEQRSTLEQEHPRVHDTTSPRKVPAAGNDCLSTKPSPEERLLTSAVCKQKPEAVVSRVLEPPHEAPQEESQAPGLFATQQTVVMTTATATKKFSHPKPVQNTAKKSKKAHHPKLPKPQTPGTTSVTYGNKTRPTQMKSHGTTQNELSQTQELALILLTEFKVLGVEAVNQATLQVAAGNLKIAEPGSFASALEYLRSKNLIVSSELGLFITKAGSRALETRARVLPPQSDPELHRRIKKFILGDDHADDCNKFDKLAMHVLDGCKDDFCWGKDEFLEEFGHGDGDDYPSFAKRLMQCGFLVCSDEFVWINKQKLSVRH